MHCVQVSVAAIHALTSNIDERTTQEHYQRSKTSPKIEPFDKARTIHKSNTSLSPRDPPFRRHDSYSSSQRGRRDKFSTEPAGTIHPVFEGRHDAVHPRNGRHDRILRKGRNEEGTARYTRKGRKGERSGRAGAIN